MNLGKKISFLWRLSPRRKVWLLACTIGSVLVLPIVHKLPSKYIKNFLGYPLNNRQLCVLVSSDQLQDARQIAELMKLVARIVPWPCECLAQALCVVTLLKLYRIPAVTYLGAKFSEEDPMTMQAHAWVCVGSNLILGEHGRTYEPVATFTTKDFSEYL